MKLDNKIILYDGLWDLRPINQGYKVVYTSLTTKNSHMMTRDYFKENYLPTQGKLYNKNIYIHKNYRRII